MKEVVRMLMGFVVFGVIAAVGVAAEFLGTDTRDGQDWMRHRSAHAH